MWKHTNRRNATSVILELVREGRASPHDAAVLLEMRRELREKRERREFWRHPGVAVVVGLAGFVLALLGVRRCTDGGWSEDP
jgi:Tfp pilus assembly protein PilN